MYSPRLCTMRYITFFLFGLFLATGCIQIMSDYVETYEEGFDYSDPADSVMFDPDYYGECEVGTCTAFVCERGDPGILERVLGLNTRSLVGGSCSFDQNFDQERQNELWEDDTLDSQPFRIGQGPTFVDFSHANRYCGNKLNLAVKWLHGKQGNPYPLPDPSRATCFLERGIMPMYILYSDGLSISSSTARTIAESFRDKGPVIIVSEMDYDSSNEDNINNVKDQIINMKSACPNCLIAYGVNMSDHNALQSLNDTSPLFDSVFNSSVDLIAFGINSKNSKQTCVPENGFHSKAVSRMYIAEVYPFMRSIRFEYNKPSVIAYMLFDTGANAREPSTHPTDPGPCIWNELQVKEAYRYFYDKALPVLAGYGAIGAAPYGYYDWENPLNCENCQLLDVDIDITTGEIEEMEPEAQKTKRFFNWFSFCHAYKVSVDEETNTFAQNDFLAVHATKPGTVCDVAQNNYRFYHESIFRTTFAGPRLELPAYEPGRETEAAFFACDACVVTHEDEILAATTTFPFEISPISLGSRAEQSCNPAGDPLFEEMVLQIDRFAELRDLDPAFVRAIIWAETDFHRCIASQTDFDRCGGSGNPYDLDNNDNTAANLPAGVTDEPHILDQSGGYGDPPTQCNLGPAQSGKKYCAYGLMAALEMPGYVYSELGIPYSNLVIQCANELQLDSIDDFNPFNITHTVCVGTAKLQDYFSGFARRAVTSPAGRAADLEVEITGTDEEMDRQRNKQNIMIAYFAAHRYRGTGPWTEDQIPLFVEQKDISAADCTGDGASSINYCSTIPSPTAQQDPHSRFQRDACFENYDFISFIRNCRMYEPSFPATELTEERFDYGSRVLARYEALRTDECGISNCPPHRRIQDALQEAEEEAGEADEEPEEGTD